MPEPSCWNDSRGARVKPRVLKPPISVANRGMTGCGARDDCGVEAFVVKDRLWRPRMRVPASSALAPLLRCSGRQLSAMFWGLMAPLRRNRLLRRSSDYYWPGSPRCWWWRFGAFKSWLALGRPCGSSQWSRADRALWRRECAPRSSLPVSITRRTGLAASKPLVVLWLQLAGSVAHWFRTVTRGPVAVVAGGGGPEQLPGPAAGNALQQ